MRKINKGSEPPDLTKWKKQQPHGRYNQLTQEIRQIIREDALKEQFYLCAYCCQRIEDVKSCHNEHIEPQNLNLQRTLDFSNIVASCNTSNQCGMAHQSQPLPLTPLMAECETELEFKISGRVEGVSDRARTTIQVLNLGDSEKNNRSLIEKRKQLCNVLLWTNGIDPGEDLEDEELLKMLIRDLSQLQDDKMEPFTPVVINILNNWLRS
ncbi:TIGR02646 family protein [Phormidium pseudopriestleyi FRX01]|uniref:TIGR02646 family protein n=1 Tax=Phormidium pseudopriestleyi FRX01 TaxID=1759528 RepID=A0ABS3FSU3_9CYAN|nr:TIGR02646 family protein [Phormidium pseudopriestleyi]MBO0350189.1 TIGR02646 family protein [Phormidium pseudopriestleyi FRX01]